MCKRKLLPTAQGGSVQSARPSLTRTQARSVLTLPGHSAPLLQPPLHLSTPLHPRTEMDKLLLLLLLLGIFPFVFFQGVAPDTLCMVCKNFKKGQCLQGKGNCTMEQGPGCRTRDFFLFSEKGRWNFNHTELDCYDFCTSSNYYIGDLKISSFCCKGRDFCNKYIGKGKE